jgi:hypothetical protein
VTLELDDVRVTGFDPAAGDRGGLQDSISKREE